jgi:hypothetical protein
LNANKSFVVNQVSHKAVLDELPIRITIQKGRPEFTDKRYGICETGEGGCISRGSRVKNINSVRPIKRTWHFDFYV